MKKQIKGFVIGVVVTAMLMTTVVFAGGVKQTIEVVMNSVNLTVNGEKVAADTILYNGTTYVPLRVTAEMLGKEVGWDQETSTASINDKGTAPVSAPANYSRNNPAPIGVTQRVKVEDILTTYTAEVTVKETIRGEKAWGKIKEANMFNQEAGEGEEYILAKIHIKAIEVEDDKKIDVSSVDFKLFSEGNTKYDDFYSVVTPKPAINTELFSGAEHEGYVAFKVKVSDKNPKIAYGLDYDGTGGIWFKLQ